MQIELNNGLIVEIKLIKANGNRDEKMSIPATDLTTIMDCIKIALEAEYVMEI